MVARKKKEENGIKAAERAGTGKRRPPLSADRTDPSG